MRVVSQPAGPVVRFVRTMLAGLLPVLLTAPAAAQTAAQATTARDPDPQPGRPAHASAGCQPDT